VVCVHVDYDGTLSGSFYFDDMVHTDHHSQPPGAHRSVRMTEDLKLSAAELHAHLERLGDEWDTVGEFP
jgi:hypothetical protein